MNPSQPTPYPDLNGVLLEFVTSTQAILGDNFIAAYLQGSFAIGDFDEDSDVDFLVAIQDKLSEADLAALQANHARLYRLESPWAQHLEGSYVPKDALRRYEPPGREFFFLDNGSQQL